MIKRYCGIAKLILADDLHPEDAAMIQALYSRNSASAETHILKIYADRRAAIRKAIGDGAPESQVDALMEIMSGNASAKADRLMNRYVVSYGHKSIADCGTTTLFSENVSMLAAKAIQDWPLYCGQETSSRYRDLSTRLIVNPIGTLASSSIIGRWMSFYSNNDSRIRAEIRRRHPRNEGEDETTYEKAVSARLFDIKRAFLPAGCTTQLSWHTNLRQAGDHLILGTKHPSAEIRGVFGGLAGLLTERYPSSGPFGEAAAVADVGTHGGPQALALRQAWEQSTADTYTYVDAHGPRFETTVTKEDLERHAELLASRPRGCVLPHALSDLGQFTFRFDLDFGSFRDIQRHRNGVCRMPLLDTSRGFEPWYLEQLDDDLREDATKLVREQALAIEAIDADPVDKQYLTAMGFKVPCSITYGLPATVYVMELRSGKAIHPTLRKIVHEMVGHFRGEFPSVPIHVDMDHDGWTIRRGKQDIVAKS